MSSPKMSMPTHIAMHQSGLVCIRVSNRSISPLLVCRDSLTRAKGTNRWVWLSVNKDPGGSLSCFAPVVGCIRTRQEPLVCVRVHHLA